MKELKLVVTGDLRPTCGDDYIHSPITWDIDGEPVRVIVRPNQPLDRVVMFVLTDVAKALGYASPRQAADSMALIEGEDRDSDSIRTPGGPQKLRVLTWKGLTKFLMRSNHEKAVAFQDVLAAKSSDLAFYGVAFADKSAAEGIQQAQGLTRVDLDAIAVVVTSAVTAAMLPILDRLTAPRTSRRGKAIQGDTLPPGEETRMYRLGCRRAADFLFREEGQKPVYGRASSLANRCANYCERNSIPFYRYGRHLFLHGDTLRQVHRFGWSAKTAILSEGQMQMGLFGGPNV